MRIAVLGCGSIGKRHLSNLLALGHTHLLAYDPQPAARQTITQELGIKCCDKLEEIWANQPHIVIIATPSDLHIALALQAARRNCHLFIEKPLSHSDKGIQPLCAEIAERRLVTMVGCNMRFHPGPQTIKKLVDESRVGQVIAARIHAGSYLPRWRPWQDYHHSISAAPGSGGALLECIHEIDLALWYFGPAQIVAAITTAAHTLDIPVDGLSEILLQHTSGALSSVHLNFVQRDYCRTCQVIGSTGTLYWNWGDKQVQVYDEEGKLSQTYPEPDGWQVNQMYIDEMEHFLQAVQTNSPASNPISGGWAALQIALTAKQMEKQA